MQQDPIDRLGPTRRPAGPPQGYQKWRTLLFRHVQVPAAALRPLIPPQLDIDTFAGHAYVGVVPFTMRDVQPLRLVPRVPGTANFHETNLRTYVHHEGRDPGVWFFSLDAANRLAVWAARTFFHLPYHLATMSLQQQGDRVLYQMQRRRSGARLSADYRIGAALPPSQPGTLQFFLAERYYLYATGGGALWRGQVHHAPYPLHEAQVQHLDETLLASAGLPADGARPPDLYSPGVDVEIFPLQRCAPLRTS